MLCVIDGSVALSFTNNVESLSDCVTVCSHYISKSVFLFVVFEAVKDSHFSQIHFLIELSLNLQSNSNQESLRDLNI